MFRDAFLDYGSAPVYVAIISRGITECNRAEEALKQVNRKLNLLSNITRHDINNQLFSLKEFLDLSKEILGYPSKMSEYIIKNERTAKAIERQIVFTKEYQDFGVKTPDRQVRGPRVHSCMEAGVWEIL